MGINMFIINPHNTLSIQIWTSLITIVLLKYLNVRFQYKCSLSNLVTVLRFTLFTFRDFYAWLDRPCEPPLIIQQVECIFQSNPPRHSDGKPDNFMGLIGLFGQNHWITHSAFGAEPFLIGQQMNRKYNNLTLEMR